ncbi:MAG TPA: hypothetical protein VGI03_06890 [Verrucomicrobiae bacterium]|jgi:hypothetical protein
MNTPRRQHGEAAFDLIEEAVHGLRTGPLTVLAVYYLGAIPFILGLLFFWGEMSRSPFAGEYLSSASLGIGLLFFWMKFWQSIFALNFRAHLTGEPPPRLTPGRCARIFLAQAVLQPIGLFLIPLSALPVIPFPRIYGFFQSATALAEAEGGPAKLLNKSWKLGAFWPRQNFLGLAVMLGFTWYIFLNWITVCLTLPELAKTLFGIQSAFTNSPESLFNSTFFAAMAALTYLCADPILKAIFTLRCFYAESVESGEDLKAELQPFLSTSSKITGLVLLLGTLFLGTTAMAANPAPSPGAPASQSISAAGLDHVINQTIHESKFVWRMPRKKMTDTGAPEGIFAQFFDDLGKTLRETAHTLGRWIDELMRKLFPQRHAVDTGSSSPGYGWIFWVEILLYGLVAAVLAVLGVSLYRIWQHRGKSAAAIEAEAIPAIPDIADENVRADQLPEDGWTKMARELLERGEFRLAMRAFYLASLSHLASRHLISIARFKSNRDYGRELQRRGHTFPALVSVFENNVFDFERIWYGMHTVDFDLVNRFAANVERIKGAG